MLVLIIGLRTFIIGNLMNFLLKPQLPEKFKNARG